MAEIYGVTANDDDLKLTLADYFDIHLDHTPKEGAELALDSIVLVARSISRAEMHLLTAGHPLPAFGQQQHSSTSLFPV